MGVFTERSIEDIAPLLEEYGISQEIVGFQGLTEGVENSSFIIITGDREYILTLIERRVDPDRIRLANELMNAGQERGLSCPAFVHTRSEEPFSHFQDRLWVLQTKLEGMPLNSPTLSQSQAAGRSLASLHVAGQSVSTHSENPVGNRQWPGLLCALESITPRANYLAREIVEDVESLRERWPARLPAGAIHGDFFKSNVLYMGDRINIIDFLLCCHDLLAFDLALALTSWGFDGDNRLEPESFSAFLRGYESVRPLLGEERSALAYLCRMAAIRILLTRAIDQHRVQRQGAVEHKDPDEFYSRYMQLRASTLE